jgi:hypothetical protein
MLLFNQWLYKSILYDNNYHIKDILNLFIKDIFDWIKLNNEIECEYNDSTFKDKFYKMIYTNYYNNQSKLFKPYDEEMYEYFTLKFSNDIIDLFLKFKYISKHYNLNLLHQKNNNSLYLQDFLFDHLLIEDPYYDSDDETDEENNINNIIDEF